MSKLLSFLLRMEDKERYEVDETNFKSMVFANSPELYGKLFEDDIKNPEEDLEFIEMQPQDENELADVLEEMKQMGVLQ